MFNPTEIKDTMKRTNSLLVKSIKTAKEALDHEAPDAERAFLYLALARTHAETILNTWELLYKKTADAEHYMKNDDAFKDVINVAFGIDRAMLRTIYSGLGDKIHEVERREDFGDEWNKNGALKMSMDHWIFGRIQELDGFDEALDAIEFKAFDMP